MGFPRRLQRLSAHAVVVDETGRILLVQLSDLTSRPGCWTLPGGGVEHGEHPADALVREVREETCLAVDAGPLLDVLSRRRPPLPGFPDDMHFINLIFSATLAEPAGVVVAEQGGTTAGAAWFGRDDVGRLPLTEVAERGLLLAADHDRPEGR